MRWCWILVDSILLYSEQRPHVMNNYYAAISTALSLFYAVSTSAQVVTITDVDGNVVNGSTVLISDVPMGDGQILGEGLAVENTSGSFRTINVRRTEVSVPSNTGNYFCWDLCYSEVMAGTRVIWTSLDPIPMDTGFVANGFHAYYKPYNIEGTAIFRYVWYDVDSPNDTAWVNIRFDVHTVGIAENTSPVLNFEVFPNPSTASDITLNYDLATAAPGTRLALYNVLGERKLVRAIATAKGKVVLHESELGSGVWFAVLERNGKPLATKRVVVLR